MCRRALRTTSLCIFWLCNLFLIIQSGCVSRGAGSSILTDFDYSSDELKKFVNGCPQAHYLSTFHV